MEEKKKNNKKKLTIGIICLVLVGIVVLLLGTYAYWLVTEKQTNKNLVGSACLQITFSNETGDINLENQWPTSDTDGSKLVPYTFTLTNTCPDELVAYTVALEEIKDDSNDPITYPDEYLSDANIKLKFDSLAPMKISTLDDITSDSGQTYEIYKTKKIINRKLAGGESRTHSLRMWLDQNAPETEMNKFFLSRIKIIAGQGIEEECYTVNSDGVLYAYDSDCGTSATIPATVKEKQVKTIASNAFKGDKQVRQYLYHDDLLYKEENDTVPTIDDFAALKNNRCGNTSGDSVNCTIDFSIACKEELYKILFDDNYMDSIYEEKGWDPEDPASEQLFYQYLAETFSPDDLVMVIYYDGNDTERANFIRNYGIEEYLSPIFELLGEETTPELINSHIYTRSNPIPDNYYEVYKATTYDTQDDEWEVYGYGGYKEPTDNYTTENKLLIDSLDLSQATNLKKIESRAFSTAPDLVNTRDRLDFSTYPGLTSLTFGNNTNNIELGGAAFSGANLSNLTIYTNYVTSSLNAEELAAIDAAIDNTGDKTFMYPFMGPFVGSHIQNLTITGAGGVTTYNGMPGVSVSNDPYKSVNVLGYLAIIEVFGYYADNITFTGNITAIDNIPNINTNWNLTLPDSLQTVGDYAFATFTGSSLTLPSSLTTIGYDAFQAYNGSTLTIPASVTRIKQGAFHQFKGTATVNNSQGDVNFDSGWINNSATVNWN